MDQYLIVAVAILATVCIGQFIRSRELKKSSSSVTGLRVENEHLTGITKEFQSDIINLQEDLGQEREKNRTLLSQKKSSETRLGQISEHLHFMGNPIDYISFDFDEGKIVLIEVKSGNSKPSKRQKIVKNIIKTGRVFYEEIRINEKGVKSKVVGLEDKVAKS
jgi:predicted Holliday junction resolvase-like endonuclease